jgi:peptidoglycan hydrolase-like protein with peptidoglycan-binding domain
LARAGYYHGAIDGILGPQTRRAIAAYERDHGGGRPKGPKGGKGKKGGYRKGGQIIVVLEEYCAKDLFVQLAAALGAPVDWKKKGKKGKKGKNGKNGKNGKKGGPKGYKGGPKGPKGGPYGYKASRGSARTRRG